MIVLGLSMIIGALFIGYIAQDEIEINPVNRIGSWFGKIFLGFVGSFAGLIVGAIIWIISVSLFASSRKVTETYRYQSYYEGEKNWIIIDSADNVLEIDKDEVSFIDGIDSVYYKVYETPIDTTYPRMESSVKWIISN